MTRFKENPEDSPFVTEERLSTRGLDPRDFGAAADGVADDTKAIQATIDKAQSMVARSDRPAVPKINLDGVFRITDTLIAKTATIEGSYPFAGAEIIWDGPAGGLAIKKDTTYTGGISFGRIAGLYFRGGEHMPQTWIEMTPNGPNTLGVLEYLGFYSCSGDAIKTARWTQANWHHLYFENPGGYAIRLSNTRPEAAHTYFKLTDFAYGYGAVLADTPPNAPGVLYVENPYGSNLGTISLTNGRVEIDPESPWGGNKAIVTFNDSSVNQHSMKFDFEGLVYIDFHGMTEDSLIHREGPNSLMFAASLRACELATISKLWSGNIPANAPKFAYPTDWASLDVTAAGGIGTRVETGAAGTRMLEFHRSAAYAGGGVPIAFSNIDETYERYRQLFNGTQEWGEGAAEPDVKLERSAAKRLKIPTQLAIGEYLNMSPLAPANAANSSLFNNSETGKLCWKDAGGTVNPLY